MNELTEVSLTYAMYVVSLGGTVFTEESKMITSVPGLNSMGKNCASFDSGFFLDRELKGKWFVGHLTAEAINLMSNTGQDFKMCRRMAKDLRFGINYGWRST